MITDIKRIELEYKRGTSDKVYNIELQEDNRWYRVRFTYGRRNSTLKSGTKCDWNSRVKAEEIFDDLVQSKLDRGYKNVKSKSKVKSAKVEPLEKPVGKSINIDDEL